MKQILAIFKKDARHFWPEILVSLAMVIALILIYPYQWRTTDNSRVLVFTRSAFSNGTLGFLGTCLLALVPVTWWILVARVVHGESLVGNTQFWLTRPYEWPKLLAAKLLFVAVFLSVPFLLAQCLLLVGAGFNPLSYISGLSYNLLLVMGIVVLPLAALSAITANFGRMTLVILGIALFIASVALVDSVLPSNTIGRVPSLIGDKLSFLIVTCGCAMVVFVQYAMRKVRLAWLLIAAIALFLAVLAFVDPDQALMDRNYPVQGANTVPTAQLSYEANSLAVTNNTLDKSELEIAIPIRAAGVPDGYAVIPVAVKASIRGPGSEHWESPWQAVYNERYLPGISGSTVHFRISRAVFDRFKSTSIALHLTFAVEQAHAVSVTSIPLSADEFHVPGFGICTPQISRFNQPPEITGINCRSAMRQLELAYIEVYWNEGSCSTVNSTTDGMLGGGWAGSFDTDPADFGITSVWETPLMLSNSWGGYNQGVTPRPRHICPNSPVTFTRYALVSRAQVGLTIQNFQLPALSIGDVYRLRMK